MQDLPQVVSGFSKKSLQKVTAFFNKISRKVVKVKNLEGAEMVKLLINSFRDLSFFFQVAMICDQHGLNTNEVINAANKKVSRNQCFS